MWGFGDMPRRQRPSAKKEGWTPKRAGAPAPDTPVPARYQGLRLRKRRAHYRDGSRLAVIIVVLVIVAITLVVVAWQRFA